MAFILKLKFKYQIKKIKKIKWNVYYLNVNQPEIQLSNEKNEQKKFIFLYFDKTYFSTAYIKEKKIEKWGNAIAKFGHVTSPQQISNSFI